MYRATHFVGFRGDEYARACRIFGRPDFIHYGWDRRAQRDIAPGDRVVFAKGDADQPVSERSFADLPGQKLPA
ncbi:MAG: hypothetical protein ACRYG4_00520 [Janthinobacterium lividum]